MKFPVHFSVFVSLVSHVARCDKDMNPGKERGEHPLPQQLHLQIYQKVFGLADLSLDVDSACETVKLPGAEVALLIALDDTDGDVIARIGWRWSNSEDLGRNDDVGLEAELVMCDACRGVLTV